MSKIVFGDNIDFLRGEEDASYDLIYIDPPFNTGKKQILNRQSKGSKVSSLSYQDQFHDYHRFIEDRLRELYRVLKPDGSFFFHIDQRESHYCKIILDGIFGRECFMNEIIWSYDFGGRSKKKWPSKHDTIFWYAKDPKNYTFNYDAIDRIPYMAPGLVGKEKAARGKKLTDTWFMTIEPTNSKRRTGFPSQKPYKLLERIVRVHSKSGDRVLDVFAGSGTTGEAAAQNGREFVLVDNNPDAFKIMRERLHIYLDDRKRI